MIYLNVWWKTSDIRDTISQTVVFGTRRKLPAPVRGSKIFVPVFPSIPYGTRVFFTLSCLSCTGRTRDEVFLTLSCLSWGRTTPSVPPRLIFCSEHLIPYGAVPRLVACQHYFSVLKKLIFFLTFLKFSVLGGVGCWFDCVVICKSSVLKFVNWSVVCFDEICLFSTSVTFYYFEKLFHLRRSGGGNLGNQVCSLHLQ